jgi:histidine triad (HIT) family protein
MERPGVSCVFCDIVAGRNRAAMVFDDGVSAAFLDARPVFPGHVLLVPKGHVETLPELPLSLVQPLFHNAQRLAAAMEAGLDAEGAFVAINNRVSQSVPHLHIHVVPRRKGDGLKGFFWPRRKYGSEEEMEEVAGRLRKALAASSSGAVDS